MQVNDEPNGVWGSWFTPPRAYALRKGSGAGRKVFPMPRFKGFWMLRPGAALTVDVPATAPEFSLTVAEPERFTAWSFARGERLPLDVLIYTRTAAGADFSRADFASAVDIDAAAKRVTFRRWPALDGDAWHAFAAGEAYVAPSAGDVYGLQGKTLRTAGPQPHPVLPARPRIGTRRRRVVGPALRRPLARPDRP